MKLTAQEILDWSEVWAPLIPLGVLLLRRPKHDWVKPIKIYLILALLINLTANVIWKRNHLGLGEWMATNLSYFYSSNGDFANTILYNIHSIIRFLLFAWFFAYMGNVFRKLNRIVPFLFLASVVIAFIFFADIREFNSLMLASEAALLLTYSLIYYLVMLRNDESQIKRPGFWVVTGLSTYVVINFPIFLFYNALSKQADEFAINIWDVHNISYIVFCLFIAKSFYE